MTMSRLLYTNLVLVALLQVTYTLAQHEPFSCADVGCPTLAGTAISNCTVAGASYPAIGLASSTSTDSDLELEWTIAVNQSKTGVNSLINRAFYLGANSTTMTRLESTSACSFFFTAADNGPLFYDAVNDVPTDCISRNGTGFTAQCVADLKRLASDMSKSDSASCVSIANAMQNDIPSTCSISSNARIVAVPITGNNSPKAITALQNSSSTCWPTLPKSNGLVPVYVASVYTSSTNDTTISNAAGTTPVMTISFDNDSSAESTAQLVCLHPVDLNDKSVQTISSNTSGAQASSMVSWIVMIVLAGSVALISTS